MSLLQWLSLSLEAVMFSRTQLLSVSMWVTVLYIPPRLICTVCAIVRPQKARQTLLSADQGGETNGERREMNQNVY